MTERWLTITDASAALGISSDAVRMRVRRGKLASEKRDGKVYVRLDTDRTPDQTATEQRPNTDLTALVEAQRAEIAFLRAELESRREADRETRILFSQMVSKIEALEAGQEATESPESDDSPEDESGSVSRPWWRFWGE